MFFIFELFIGYLLADFIGGLFHWIEDKYFYPSTPLIGNIILENWIHHKYPRDILKYNIIENMYIISSLTIPVMIVLMTFGLLNVALFSALLLLSITNYIHKINHMTEIEMPIFVRLIKKIPLIQTTIEHHTHHTNDHSSNYHIIGRFMNPISNYIGLWKKMEYVIFKLTGIKPHDEKDKMKMLKKYIDI